MITIIKYGTIKKKRCDSCGCGVAYEEEDISIHDDIEFALGSRYPFIACPQCKEEIKLEVTK